MEDLQKSLYINELFDVYGELLTTHQQLILKYYYQMDLSLSEISEQLDISRNGVYDALKKGTNLLEKYETILHIIEKKKKLENYFDKLKNENNKDIIKIINEIESMVK